MFKTLLRLLTFRLTREEMMQFNKQHLYAGFTGTWIVGMGRYWDDPKASFIQHTGLGSIIYIFLLAALIWAILKPFRLPAWDYRQVLTFISLTSFPAILYAIPVELFMGIDAANHANVCFLAIVATWRLALLYFFLKRYTALYIGTIVTVTLLPVCLIITVLTILNLDGVVFEIMGGMRNPTPYDSSYFFLLFLTGISMILIVPLLIAYAFGIYESRKSNGNKL